MAFRLRRGRSSDAAHPPDGGTKRRRRISGRARLLLAVAATLAIAALSFGPLAYSTHRSDTASQPTMPAVGVQFHAFWDNYTDAQREVVLDRLAEAGVGWVRIDYSWAMLQPDRRSAFAKDGVAFFDRVVDMVEKRHLKILLTFWRTPAWANHGAGELVPPTNPKDYANALAWLVKRYGDRVAAWEIWNEPNDPDYFVGADPKVYTGLLRAAYRAVKAVRPEATVVFGGPSYNDTDWIERAYEAGAGGFFDVMSTHPYQAASNLPPEAPDDGTIWRLTHVSTVRDVMIRHGDGNKEIWFTEFGWSSHGNGPNTASWNYGVSRQQQADYLVRTLDLVADSYPYVTHVFWYRDRDWTGDNPQIDNYGLLDANLNPKPAWESLRLVLRGRGRGTAG